jgi:hypothetical protein
MQARIFCTARLSCSLIVQAAAAREHLRFCQRSSSRAVGHDKQTRNNILLKARPRHSDRDRHEAQHSIAPSGGMIESGYSSALRIPSMNGEEGGSRQRQAFRFAMSLQKRQRL